MQHTLHTEWLSGLRDEQMGKSSYTLPLIFMLHAAHRTGIHGSQLHSYVHTEFVLVLCQDLAAGSCDAVDQCRYACKPAAALVLLLVDKVAVLRFGAENSLHSKSVSICQLRQEPATRSARSARSFGPETAATPLNIMTTVATDQVDNLRRIEKKQSRLSLTCSGSAPPARQFACS